MKTKQKNNFFLKKVDTFLSIIEEYLMSFFIVVALIIGSLQVIFRYVFNVGSAWSETAFIICTICAMFMAGSRAVKTEQHIAVDVFVLLFNNKIQFFFKKLCYLIFLFLTIYYFFAGFEYVQFSKLMEIVSPETGVPEWFFYATVPVAMSLFSLRLIIKIFDSSNGNITFNEKIKIIIKNG